MANFTIESTVYQACGNRGPVAGLWHSGAFVACVRLLDSAIDIVFHPARFTIAVRSMILSRRFCGPVTYADAVCFNGNSANLG